MMKITPEQPVTREQTARHEAGHATVAVALGVDVYRLAMPEHGDHSGTCDTGPREALARVVRDISGVDITNDMLVTAAGPVAGFLHRAHSWPCSAPGDAGFSEQIERIFQADSRDELCRLRTTLTSAGAKRPDATIWEICLDARKLLELGSQLCARLADELLRCADLDAEHIERIVSAVRGR